MREQSTDTKERDAAHMSTSLDVAYVEERMAELLRIVGKVAAGDYSEAPRILEREDPLSEFVVGFKFMIEDLETAHNEQRRKTDELRLAYDRLGFQAALLESQSESSPDGVLVVDPAGKILSYNRRFVEMWKIPDDVIASGSDDQALASVMSMLESPEEFMERVRHLYEHPAEESREDVRLTDGRIFDRRTLPLVGEAGQSHGRVWYFRDVTREKDAAAELASAYERMRDLTRMKTQFINTVAHELATPLTPIELQMHMLEGVLKNGTEAQKSEAVQILRRNFTRLAQLVQEVLDVARLESNQLTVSLKAMDLNRLLGEVVASFDAQANAKQVKLSAEAEPGLRVIGDDRRLTQVLYNLVSNGLKFTPAGQRITIFAQVDGSNALVRVVDTGMGLSDDDFPRLFRPFSQVHDPMQHTRSGTGLGLYICSGIVERHGGRIWVDSEGPGLGSTFSFTVPLARPEQEVLPHVDDQDELHQEPMPKAQRIRYDECPRCHSKDVSMRLIKNKYRCSGCDHEWR